MEPFSSKTLGGSCEIVVCAALYNLWNMVPWFIIKQTQTKMAKLITCRPPTVLLENGSMVHNQTIMNKNGYDHFRFMDHGTISNGQIICRLTP